MDALARLIAHDEIRLLASRYALDQRDLDARRGAVRAERVAR